MKTEYLKIRVSPEERANIEKLADQTGYSISDIGRECINIHCSQLLLIEQFALAQPGVAGKFALATAVTTVLARHHAEMPDAVQDAYKALEKALNAEAERATIEAYRMKAQKVYN